MTKKINYKETELEIISNDERKDGFIMEAFDKENNELYLFAGYEGQKPNENNIYFKARVLPTKTDEGTKLIFVEKEVKHAYENVYDEIWALFCD